MITYATMSPIEATGTINSLVFWRMNRWLSSSGSCSWSSPSFFSLLLVVVAWGDSTESTIEANRVATNERRSFPNTLSCISSCELSVDEGEKSFWKIEMEVVGDSGDAGVMKPCLALMALEGFEKKREDNKA